MPTRRRGPGERQRITIMMGDDIYTLEEALSMAVDIQSSQTFGGQGEITVRVEFTVAGVDAVVGQIIDRLTH